MVLPVPTNDLESTRDVRFTKVNIDENTGSVAELAYELKHSDGSVDPCWGIHLIGATENQYLADAPLGEWTPLPVRLGAIRDECDNLYVGITQIQLGNMWIRPLKTATDRLSV